VTDNLHSKLTRTVQRFERGEIVLSALVYEIENFTLGDFGEDIFATFYEPLSEIADIDADTADNNYQLNAQQSNRVKELLETIVRKAVNLEA
jgi:hypothetical protein